MDVLAPAEEAAEAVGEPEIAPGTGVAADIELAPVDTAEEQLSGVATANAAGDGVPIDEVRFPDPVFRGYVQDNFDTDADGFLTDVEAAAVTIIDIGVNYWEGGVTNCAGVEGVEYFPNLEVLCVRQAKLESLDVSNNLKLIKAVGSGKKTADKASVSWQNKKDKSIHLCIDRTMKLLSGKKVLYKP